MFKRLFWLVVGIAFGFGCSFWLMRAARAMALRYSPERVTGDVAGALRAFGADLRAAAREARQGMAEAEADIRARLEPGANFDRR
ncbi:MAG TPA: hypothetical protein VGA13_04555 [Acidimicrobiales bacterium]|jgi:hypothetical protein